MTEAALVEMRLVITDLICRAWGWHEAEVRIDEGSIFAISKIDKRYATFQLGIRPNVFVLFDDLTDYFKAQILLNGVESLKEEWEDIPNDQV